MTINTFSGGIDTSFTSKLNDNFKSFQIVDVYTSTGFDGDWNNVSTDQTSSHEFDAIASSTLADASYLEIYILAMGEISMSASSYRGRLRYKLEAKEVGGSYSTVFEETVMRNEYYSTDLTVALPISYYHTLTSGEKTNGVQFQLTVTFDITNGGTNHNGAITNKQVVFKAHG